MTSHFPQTYLGKKLADSVREGAVILCTSGCASFGYPPLPSYQLESKVGGVNRR